MNEFLKEFTTEYFWWWFNAPGQNTQEGYDLWIQTDKAKSILKKYKISLKQELEIPALETELKTIKSKKNELDR